MKLQPGWTFLGILKNIFFLLLFIQILPLFFVNIKNNIDEVLHNKTEVGYLFLRGEINDSTSYVKRLQQFEADPAIEGLIVKVDCPGGISGASQAAFRAFSHFKSKKPIVVFVENICTSGAYYAICGANKIIVNPSSLLGSIGTYMRAPNVKELLDSWKIRHYYIQAGEFKTTLDPFKDVIPENLASLQTLADDCYNQFVTDVATQRGLDPEQHKAWANGRLFSGSQAKDHKLVDDFGSYHDAIDAMAKILEVPEKEIKLVSNHRGIRGIRQLFMDDEEEFGMDMKSSLATSAAQFCAQVYKEFTIQVNTGQPEMRS